MVRGGLGEQRPHSSPQGRQNSCLPLLLSHKVGASAPTANPPLLPVSLLCRHCLLFWREEGKVAKARLLPSYQGPPRGGGSAGPADPQGTPRKWPHRIFLTHHPTPNLAAPSCQPLCSACVNFFTWLASQPPRPCTTGKTQPLHYCESRGGQPFLRIKAHSLPAHCSLGPTYSVSFLSTHHPILAP